MAYMPSILRTCSVIHITLKDGFATLSIVWLQFVLTLSGVGLVGRDLPYGSRGRWGCILQAKSHVLLTPLTRALRTLGHLADSVLLSAYILGRSA